MAQPLLRAFLILTGLLAALSVAAQPAEVTIAQIQQTPPDSIAAGKLTSPLLGDTVVFVGVAQAATVADRSANDFRPILTAGRRYVNYIQDTNGVEFGGIVVLADNDTIARETLFDRIDSGDVVRITGIVQQFPTTPNGNNQIVVARNSEVEILYHTARPAPVLTTIGDFYHLNGAVQEPQYTTGAKWAGTLVEMRDVTVKSSSVSTSGSSAGRVTMYIVDEAGNEIRVRDQSGYFLARAAAARLEYVGQVALDHILVVDTTDFYVNGFGTYKPPTPGTRIARIVGAISSNLSGGQTAPFQLTPMYPDDLEISTVADELASISSVRREIGVPTADDSVGITFVAIRGTNPISDDSVYVGYRVIGGGDGSVGALRTGDTTFRAVIPAQTAGSIVTYWIVVPDSKGQAAMSPRDTLTYKYFYKVIAPGTNPTIRDIQYTPNLSGTSSYNGFAVTVSGTVVADTSDIPGDRGEDPQVVIQSGREPWSGLWIAAKGMGGEIHPDLAAVRHGDSITVSGTVRENFDLTTLTNVTTVTNHGAVQLPEPVILSTGDIGQKPEGQPGNGEPWEGMLISYWNPTAVVVTAVSADGSNNYGEFLLSDRSFSGDFSKWTRVETDNSNTGFTTRTPSEGEVRIDSGMVFESVRGILYFSFSNYKLVPRNALDYERFTSAPSQPGFVTALVAEVLPNPVSDRAILEFTTRRTATVSIAIIDQLGVAVATPISRRAFAEGGHRLELPISGMPVGVYYVRVSTETGSTTRPFVITR